MRPLHRLLEGKKAVLCDMDGTLVDSIGLWNDADRQLARELTSAAPDRAEIRAFREAALRRFRQEKEPYMCYCALLKEKYKTDLSPEQLHARRADIAAEMLERMDYRPGADRFLRALKARGYTLVLATTGRRRSIDVYRTRNRNFAQKAPIDETFDLVYTCEDVKAIKPDPEIYRRALGDLGLPASACVALEDSLSGVQAAKGAGLEVCVIYDEHSDPDRAAIGGLADWQVPDFPALLGTLGLE